MSHDIYFWHAKQGQPDHAEAQRYLAGLPNFTVLDLEGGHWQAFYENQDTGVSFSLDVDVQAIGKPEVEVEVGAKGGYWKTGLSLCLNYFRPSFFGREAMPYAEQFGRRFGLAAYDPQEDRVVADCDASALNDIWQRHNQEVIRSLRDRPEFEGIHSVPKETLLAWWEYSRKKASLQRSMGEAVFVPSIMFLQEKSTGQIRTAIVWPDAIPEVFPRCDVIIIGRTRKKWFGFGKTEEQGWLPFDEVMELISFALEPLDNASPHPRVLPFGKEKGVKDLFFKWRLNPFGKDVFEGVPVFRLVDQE